MDVEYFRKKQINLQNEISLEFIRSEYMDEITSKERLAGLIGHRGAVKLHYSFSISSPVLR